MALVPAERGPAAVPGLAADRRRTRKVRLRHRGQPISGQGKEQELERGQLGTNGAI